MNDEIKEILDKRQDRNNITMSKQWFQRLLNYITNLQEKIDELDEENYKQAEWLKRKQQKIDKAIEYMNKNSVGSYIELRNILNESEVN